MPHSKSRVLAQLAAPAALFVLWSFALGQDPAPKKAPAKDGGKQANPLQGLRDAFAKGVTTTVVDVKDLPKTITDAAAKQVPGASIRKAQRQVIRHTLKYIAFDKPRVQVYQVVVARDDQRVRVQVAPDGKKQGTRPVEAGKDKAAEAGPKKEIDIPQAARKAVQAIKDLYPNAVVEEITTEVYQDPSGTIDILTYEVEFVSKGVKREMVASPEGVIPHLWKPVAEKDLPQAVADTVAKAVPGGKVESAKAFEVRAGLQFAPLARPRVVYQLETEKDGAAGKLAVRADGTIVPAPVRPGGPRAFLGVAFEQGSTVVSQVTKDGPAERAGIQKGDRILALGDAKVSGPPEVLRVLRTLRPGTEVPLQIQRGDQNLKVSVKLAAPPG
jgi:hypothetical protein